MRHTTYVVTFTGRQELPDLISHIPIAEEVIHVGGNQVGVHCGIIFVFTKRSF